jgi:ATP-dependent exoDNAse (exonuclease V) alpha subunit
MAAVPPAHILRHISEADKVGLDELELRYTTTINKSQGSEYPVVVIPVSTQHYMMLMSLPE